MDRYSNIDNNQETRFTTHKPSGLLFKLRQLSNRHNFCYYMRIAIGSEPEFSLRTSTRVWIQILHYPVGICYLHPYPREFCSSRSSFWFWHFICKKVKVLTSISWNNLLQHSILKTEWYLMKNTFLKTIWSSQKIDQLTARHPNFKSMMAVQNIWGTQSKYQIFKNN